MFRAKAVCRSHLAIASLSDFSLHCHLVFPEIVHFSKIFQDSYQFFFTNQSSYNVSSKQSCKISKAYGARLIAFIIRQNFNTNEEHFNRKIKDFSPT